METIEGREIKLECISENGKPAAEVQFVLCKIKKENMYIEIRKK